MSTPAFEYEFYSELELLDPTLEVEAETFIRGLQEGHTDIVGASVAIDELTGSETPHWYEARVEVYVRPENVVATEKDDTAQGALQGALNAVERQIRNLREKHRETWKQP